LDLKEFLMKVKQFAIGLLTLGMVAIPTSTALAQDMATPSVSLASVGMGTVTVLGQGTVSLQPDTATIQIGISVQQATLDESLDEANATMSAILTSLTDLGIAGEDIQTTAFNVYAVRDYATESTTTLPPVIGYNVSNQVSVTVRDLEWESGMPSDRVGQVIGAAVEAGANDIYGISFSVEDAAEFESQARALAVENAGERAAELAVSAGKEVGEVIAMAEGVSYEAIPYMGARDMAAQGAGGAGAPIMGGSVQILIEVTVTYELV
jgi:hypothetical protein